MMDRSSSYRSERSAGEPAEVPGAEADNGWVDIEFLPSAAQMRRFLRNVKTGLYYSYGEWVADYRMAQHFQEFHAAAELAWREKLEDVEMVLQLGPSPSVTYDVHFRLEQTFSSFDESPSSRAAHAPEQSL